MVIIRVKNMVCPRCIMVVESLLQALQLKPQQVTLGQAVLAIPRLQPAQQTALQDELLQAGFGLVEDSDGSLTEAIKNIVVSQVHYRQTGADPVINWSKLLSATLHRDYSFLSKRFSEHEGMTIEQYIIRQKTERVKELLLNHDLSLSQIAYDMHYSSTAHLSAQFKKVTGCTPSQYKQQALPARKPLDAI